MGGAGGICMVYNVRVVTGILGSGGKFNLDTVDAVDAVDEED